MALHANFHLPLRRKPRRIYDAAPDLLRRQPLLDRLKMRLSGTVTTLAINPCGQPLWKARGCLPGVGLRRSLNNAVVTGHAAVCELTAKARVIRPVIAWTHSPITALFRIPSQRKLR